MALFYQKGTISDFSEVQSGTTQSGKDDCHKDHCCQSQNRQDGKDDDEGHPKEIHDHTIWVFVPTNIP